MTTPNTPANGGQILTDERIQELALANGFKLKEQPSGAMALNPYVFDFVAAIIADLRASLAAPAELPVAWMKTHTKECTSASHKKWMENAGFGVWGEVAEQYAIPLYSHPAAPAIQTVDRNAAVAPCPFCPVEMRNLHAVAHNIIVRMPEIYRGELKRAVEKTQPLMDAHFANCGKQTAVAQPAAQVAVSEDAPAQGTFACPICGRDEPHGHSDEVVAAYRNDQIRDDDWISTLLRQPEESGWYLCSGVEVAPRKDDSQHGWFIWVRDFMRRSSKDIAEVLYWDQLDKNWYLRNALGNAVHSGQENRRPVAAIPRLWREIPAVKDRATPATVKTVGE